MKTSKALERYLIIVPALLILAALNAEISAAHAQGTAFTYQGRLNNGTNPVTGGYDMTFSLYTANAGGTLIGGPVTNLAVGVTNGLFTTSINFGAAFTGSPAWLAIGVRTNGTGNYSGLTPLQQLTPTPYAITAENLSGPVPSADLSGIYSGAVNLSNGANSFSGSGSGLTGLNASALATGTVPDARLAADVALTDANQTFTATNIFETGTNNGRFLLQGNVGIDTSLFTGLGFQFYGSSGEGAIMSAYNDRYASLSFYTKQGNGFPVAKQVVIDRYGGVAIDQQANNAGVINNGTTNGVGLTFGSGSGEGIASQRTSGINADGLDFYTGYNHRMSILHNGNVGINNTNPMYQLDVAGTVNAANFSGSGSGLTGLNASALAAGTVPDGQLAGDVALTDANQTFTATNIFETGTNNGRFLLQGNAGIDTSLFTGLGFQFYNGSGEGAIMSSYNDKSASLSFYTKQGSGYPVAKQVVIDRYGVVSIDQQDNNNGVLNDGTTNGAGLTFGINSGVGIASQRTAGINNSGLDFYTGGNHRMSILHNGNVGINNTNPMYQLDVAGTVSAISFSGSGAGLTNLNFSQITGTIPVADLPSILASITDPGSANFFAGQYAGNSFGFAGNNTAVGYAAMNGDLTGGENSAFGVAALEFVSSGNYNTASGYQALSSSGFGSVSGSGNTVSGAYAMVAAETASNNVAIGYQALSSATADNGTVAVGYQALQKDTATGGSQGIGSANNAVGYQALQANTSGGDNTAVGYQALNANVTGNNNSAFGAWALLANTGNLNTAAGVGALAGGTGSSGGGNTASGAYALTSLTTGYNNVAVGLQALFTNTVGYDNVSVGVSTLYADAQGHQNTAVGTYAFQGLTSGSGNIAIGYAAGGNLTSGNNNIYIGSSGVQGDSGVIRIGSGDSQVFLSGTVQGTVGIEGLNVDSSGFNIGNVNSNALTFGVSSGEGICSKRNGTNPYDLELWTDFTERVKVAQNGNVGIATDNPSAALEVNGNAVVDDNLSTATLTIRGGSDLAEPFKISNPEADAPEGAVVVIDAANPGHLKLSDRPYDQHVAGVISGANGIHPGIQMQQQGLLDGGRNVALTGRVYVQADTSNGPIFPGDMLTTSRLPGRAMRVTDHGRAEGAILGKAMTSLMKGKGMVLVLVTLQ